MRTILSFIVFVGLVVLGSVYYFKYYHTTGTSTFRTAKVERGDMSPTIEATGTLEPEEVVDIGAQVAGLITELKVDYGSKVEKGTVLAFIDQTMYKATVEQNEASLARAVADLGQMKATLALAKVNLDRDAALIKKNAIAPSDYDTAFAASEVAKANVGVGEAVIKQAEATLKQSKTNLGYCNITSPVKGVIVDRRVNVGQTVVSSLSAPSLFLLAKDLSRIQVWASVNEADIGRIHPGMKVHFTVDAFPNDVFFGEVLQVRLNATMTQNVVTYTVIVTTENKDMKLLPYMTASLKFEIDRHENILKVPNAALRWKPQPAQIAPDVREETLAAMGSRGKKSKRGDENKSGEKPDQRAKGSGVALADSGQDSALATSSGTAAGSSPQDWKARSEKKGGKKADSARSQGGKRGGEHQPPGTLIAADSVAKPKEHTEAGRLWIVDGNYVRPIPVRIVATDGTMTEVSGQDVSEDMEVAIGVSTASDSDTDTTNPFMPKLFKGGSKSK
jgi:HlyD family secretion protein